MTANVHVIPAGDQPGARRRRPRDGGRAGTRWQTRVHRDWVAGTPREIARRLSVLHGAGVEWLVLSDGLEAEVMAGELLASQVASPSELVMGQDAVPAS